MEEPAPTLKTSVLIVSYNCEPALRRCLEALEATQPREIFEILVVDKGSRDGSPLVDVDYPNVTVLRLPRNFGRTKARNIGARTAKGDYLLLLEPEIEVLPDTVATLTERLEAEPEAVAVCPLIVDSAGEPVSKIGPLPAPNDLYRAWAAGKSWEKMGCRCVPPDLLRSECAPVEYPDSRAVLVRSQFVRGMNYFDERYGEFGSDLELFRRVRGASRHILLLPSVKVITHGDEGLWSPDSAARTALVADYGIGIIGYSDKHFGWGAGLKVRLRMWFRALATLQLGLLTQLLGGQKIDGSQQAL